MSMTLRTVRPFLSFSPFLTAGLCTAFMVLSQAAWAQEPLPWKNESRSGDYDTYREVPQSGQRYDQDAPPAYVPPSAGYDNSYGSGSAYNRGPDVGGRGVGRDDRGDAYDRADYDRGGRGNDAYRPDKGRYDDRDYRDERRDDGYRDPGGLPPDPVVRDDERGPNAYSQDEILSAGHSFFGSISQGLADVVERAFREQGRPNGYILGEDAGGAFVAGLRYGEGTLYTRDAGKHRVYWQGPTIGYDFGAEGSKTMVLIYNLRHPGQIYQRFAGVQGSAYVVGGVGLQVMKRDDVTLAPIRSGVGLRLGANVGYLKYTRAPTWNPF